MSRTTLDIDRPVLERLRSRAVAEGKSMGQVASEALAVGLRERAKPKPKPSSPSWPSEHMGRALVNVEGNEALWKVLDEGYLRKADP